MTPVILLSDGYIANAAEPWLIPDVDELPGIDVSFRTDPADFHPFQRDPAPWRGRGCGPARQGSSIASAGWRRTSKPATSRTIPKTTSA